MKNIVILGSSGSIGQQALAIAREKPDEFKIVGLTVNSNVNQLMKDIIEFKPLYVWVENNEAREKFFELQDNSGPIIKQSRLVSSKEMAAFNDVDIVLSAMVGIVGIEPAYRAVRAGKVLAMANKEVIVTGGRLLRELADKYGGAILPVDSEHSALWQCLRAGAPKEVKKLIITASGGAFRDYTKEQLAGVNSQTALNHPIWKMGKKVTIDSATLMNKGLEVIEAMYLFDVPVSKIKVVQHPQSIVHSMVEFVDNTVMACMSTPDMKIPIQLAMTYPQRLPASVPSLDLTEVGRLDFCKPDTSKFPCLDMAYEAVAKGESAVVALNAANEVLVNRFIAGKIGFMDIPKYNRIALDNAEGRPVTNFNDILSIDGDTKKYILNVLKN